MTDSKGDTRHVSLRSIGKVSWIMIFISLLIDTSHTWAFPSHNIIIGVFSCYVGEFGFPDNNKAQVAFTYSKDDHNILLKSLTCYSTLSAFTIIVDIVFCFIWGRQVRSIEYVFNMNIKRKTFSQRHRS